MKIASIALAVMAVAALAGCATVKKPAYDTLIAHRGESKDAPENTLPAYKLAVERGFGQAGGNACEVFAVVALCGFDAHKVDSGILQYFVNGAVV